jgi:hypothetical protein
VKIKNDGEAFNSEQIKVVSLSPVAVLKMLHGEFEDERVRVSEKDWGSL